MKGLLVSILLVLCFVGFSQTPYQTPYQKVGSPTTAQRDAGGRFIDSTLVIPNYPDTFKANRSKVSLYAGAEITVGNVKYFRSADATRWISSSTPSCPPNGLIAPIGSATWNGDTLSFFATKCYYVINCIQYFSDSTTLVLTQSNPSYDRFDRIVVDTSGHAIILTGTPSLNPQPPPVNPNTQVELTLIYVPRGSTTPGGQSMLVIYDEVAGSWGGSSDVPSINFAYGTNPYSGVVSTYIPNAPNNSFVSWQYGSSLLLSNNAYTRGYIKLNAVIPSDPEAFLEVQYFLGNTPVSSTFKIVDGAYGFNANNTSTYQPLVLPNYLLTYSSGALFDRIKFTINGAPASFQLDKFYLIQGAVTPPNPTGSAWLLQGNPNTDPNKDGTGTSDSTRWNWITNGTIRAYIDANGIVHNDGDTTQNILLIDPVTGKISKTYFPTIRALGCLKIYDSTSAGITHRYIRDTCSGGGGGSGWDLTGNSISSGNFLGTTNDEDLVFKRNNVESGRLSDVLNNTSYGVGTLSGGAVTGQNNTIIGFQAGNIISSGSFNTIIGGEVAGGILDTGGGNVIIGSGSTVVDGSTNNSIAIGRNATAGTGQFALSSGIVEFKLPGVTGFTTPGYVLTTDGTVATFQPAGGGSSEWTPDGSGNIYRATGNVWVGSATGDALFQVDDATKGNVFKLDPVNNFYQIGTNENNYVRIYDATGNEALDIGLNGDNYFSINRSANTATLSRTDLTVAKQVKARNVIGVTANQSDADFTAVPGTGYLLNTLGIVSNTITFTTPQDADRYEFYVTNPGTGGSWVLDPAYIFVDVNGVIMTSLVPLTNAIIVYISDRGKFQVMQSN